MGDGGGGISELRDAALDLPSEPVGRTLSMIPPIDSQILPDSDSLSLPSEPSGIINWFSTEECDDLFGDSILQEDVRGQEEGYFLSRFIRPNGRQRRGGDFLLFGRNSKEIDKCAVLSNVVTVGDAEAKENNGFVDHHIQDDEANQVEAAEMRFSLENVLSRVKCEDGHSRCQRFSLIHSKDVAENGGSCTEEDYIVPAIKDGKSRNKGACDLKNVLASSKHENDEKMIIGPPTGAFISPKSRDDHFIKETTNLVAEKKKCAVSAARNNRSEEKKGCGSKSRHEGCPTLRKDQMAASRRPFSEMSNFVPLNNLDQKVGKWQCPRKRKAELGPPMKQLRLEQWVRQSETKHIQHIR
ncbi:unnamed protein product [Victoria cruziana]